MADAGAVSNHGLTGRVILHLDADCFYCQVEHRRLGISQDVPLAVQQWAGLIAVNYAARAAGISRHCNCEEAKKLCPDIKLVHVELIGGEKGENGGEHSQADPEKTGQRESDKVSLRRYREASVEIFQVLQRFGTVEKASVDEAYLDVTNEVAASLREADAAQQDEDGDDHNMAARVILFAPEASGSNVYGEIDLGSEADLRLAAGAKICARAREAVKRETGFTLSAGISHNKMLAKLASSQNKPNKQTIVPSSGVQSLMLTLPLKNIRGLGGKLGAQVVKQLFPVQAGADANLHASDLQPFSEAELSRLFGGKTAVWLSRVCRGHDDEPVKERDKSKSILAFKSFSAVKTPGETIDRWLRMLSEELADRVLSERDTHSRAPRTVVLHFRGRTLGSRSMPMSSGATADGVTEAASAAILYEQAHTLLGRAGAEAFPCTRLALGAADFRESMTGQGSISHFFSAQATSSGHKSQPTPEGPLTSSSPVANQMSPSSLRSADSKDAVELSSFSAKVSPDSNHIARLASAPEKRSADPARVAFPLAEEKEAEVASVSARGPAEVKQDAISKHKAHGTQQQGMMQFLHSTSQAGSQASGADTGETYSKRGSAGGGGAAIQRPRASEGGGKSAMWRFLRNPSQSDAGRGGGELAGEPIDVDAGHESGDEGSCSATTANKHGEAMKSLSDMGFSDSASTRAALETAKGDVGRAIETLLGKGLAAGATSQPQPLRERNAVGTPIGCGRGKKRAAPRAAGQGSIDSMFAKQQRH